MYMDKKEAFASIGRGTRVVVSIAAFHARVRGGLGSLKENKYVSSHSSSYACCVDATGSVISAELLLYQFRIYAKSTCVHVLNVPK